ncbi:6-pyruvoyl tetrahydrobiopterin synthase [Pseudodesulfovibrio sp. JC047]|uniref:6-pyruvoyl trahydropterin synthase family protein n=1 Tax=Pseudodesulfovibrio sp. JC047 TaxID=2683199 RepID=UPI0013D67570|nr:6-pyruvoyl tetrahydropterin synthase family protein [Pseudodesulfovibrio sp. JC047]NDV19450.1 6-pyruvoyl tetrahydrobiopterin synthase [Pseudodesulfovibrio sp. JC047]
MYSLNVDSQHLNFSAAHFITFAGKCERLHGHNYAVGVYLEGGLTEDDYVYDFVELKKKVKALCDTLDHKFLLPTENPQFQVTFADGEVEIRVHERRYVFPERDVQVVPVSNITAECLAKYLAGELLRELTDSETLSVVQVSVEEAPGQAASFRIENGQRG